MARPSPRDRAGMTASARVGCPYVPRSVRPTCRTSRTGYRSTPSASAGRRHTPATSNAPGRSPVSVNDTVRELVGTLRHEHELSQTLVVFTSDNGFMLHEHDLTDKNKAYDESVHVPLVVRGPGFLGGARVGSTVSLADVTATILRSAGASGTHGGDGVPLQDVLADPASFGAAPSRSRDRSRSTRSGRRFRRTRSDGSTQVPCGVLTHWSTTRPATGSSTTATSTRGSCRTPTWSTRPVAARRICSASGTTGTSTARDPRATSASRLRDHHHDRHRRDRGVPTMCNRFETSMVIAPGPPLYRVIAAVTGTGLDRGGKMIHQLSSARRRAGLAMVAVASLAAAGLAAGTSYASGGDRAAHSSASLTGRRAHRSATR